MVLSPTDALPWPVVEAEVGAGGHHTLPAIQSLQLSAPEPRPCTALWPVLRRQVPQVGEDGFVDKVQARLVAVHSFKCYVRRQLVQHQVFCVTAESAQEPIQSVLVTCSPASLKAMKQIAQEPEQIYSELDCVYYY